MSDKTAIRVELTQKQLEDLRGLASHLGYTLIAGQRAGEGSVRQMLAALGDAVEMYGAQSIAEALRALLPKDT